MGDVYGHGAVHMNGQRVHLLRLDQFTKQKEEFLCASHGERGNHHGPAATGRALDNCRKAGANVFLWVQTVAVSGFQQHVIEPIFRRRRSRYDQLGKAAQIAREKQLFDTPVFPDRHLDHARPKDVSGKKAADGEMRRNLDWLKSVHRMEILERLEGFLIGVERQGRGVFAEPLLVGELRIFFLEVSGVRQHDLGEIDSRRGSQDPAAKAVLDQARDVTDVVEVGVRQHQPSNARRRHGQRIPVAQPQLFIAVCLPVSTTSGPRCESAPSERKMLSS